MLTYSGSIQGQGDQFSPDYVLDQYRDAPARPACQSPQSVEDLAARSPCELLFEKYRHSKEAHIGNVTDLNEALNRETPFYTEDSPGFSINNPRQATQHYTVGSNSQIDLNANTHLHIAAGYPDKMIDRSLISGVVIEIAFPLLTLSYVQVMWKFR